MNASEYQKLAAFTIGCTEPLDMGRHGALGLCAELEELNEAIRTYDLEQSASGDNGDEKEHIIKEFGDVWWMIAELCTSINFNLATATLLGPKSGDPMKEACKIAGIYQKTYQGHPVDEDNVLLNLVEICRKVTLMQMIYSLDTDQIWKANIEKLKKRYPDGFESARSLNRAEGDI